MKQIALRIETFGGNVHYVPYPKDVPIPSPWIAGKCTDRFTTTDKGLRDWLNTNYGAWMEWKILDRWK